MALPPFAGDDAYRAAMDRVVVPIVRAFAPDAIVAQCGVDHHHADPLSHTLTTMPLYPELWRRLVGLADGGLRRAARWRWAAAATSPARPRRARLGGPGRARWPGWRWGTIRCPRAGAGSPSRPAAPSRRTAGSRTAGPAPDPERDRRAAAESEAAIQQTLVAHARFWPVG